MNTLRSHELKHTLAEKLVQNYGLVSKWFEEKTKSIPVPFYGSVDLRDSGHKIVPVDNNLYPAGFNNLCPEDLRHAPKTLVEQIKVLSKKIPNLPPNPKVALLTENHTSNLYYWENVSSLLQIFAEAELEVRAVWFGAVPESELFQKVPFLMPTADHKQVPVYPFNDTWRPDLIVLNNDFSGGYPKDLDTLNIPIVPSHKLGWHSRKKSDHFNYYNKLVEEFAAQVGFDPWHLQIDTVPVEPVDFNEEKGIQEVYQVVKAMLERTQVQYDRHQVSQKPFVFVKNNSGTYGMGIMVIHEAEELLKLNRREKNKMSFGKNKSQISSLAVQEGVPTQVLIDRLAAEPVIYLMGSELIGGFLRTNEERGVEDNLNSKGMVFRKLCMSDLKFDEEIEEVLKHQIIAKTGELPVLELVYGTVAKLSALATGMEILAHSKSSQ